MSLLSILKRKISYAVGGGFLLLTTQLYAESPLSFSGDLRARTQIYTNRFSDKEDMYEGEVRLRLDARCKLSENASFRLRGVAEAASVPNLDARLQDGSELSLDRACVSLQPFEKTSIILGETDNPFSLTIPQIDKDIPVLGIVLSHQIDDWLKLQCAYDAGRRMAQDTESQMAGLQAIAEWKTQNMAYSLNAGSQHWFDLDENFRLANSPDAEFDILSCGGSVTFNQAGIPVKTFFEYARNLAMEKQDDAFMAGIKLGQTEKPGHAALTVQYRYIKQDSLVAGVTFRDNPRTNFNVGSVLMEYRASKHIVLYGFLGLPKHIEPVSQKDDERQHTVEVGMVWKF